MRSPASEPSGVGLRASIQPALGGAVAECMKKTVTVGDKYVTFSYICADFCGGSASLDVHFAGSQVMCYAPAEALVCNS